MEQGVDGKNKREKKGIKESITKRGKEERMIKEIEMERKERDSGGGGGEQSEASLS